MDTAIHRHPDSDAAWAEPRLGPKPFLHPGVRVRDSVLGGWTELGAGTLIEESRFGDYSYCDHDCTLVHADIGRFCSIAARVRLNPGQHPMRWAMQHHAQYRRSRFGFGEDDALYFAARRQARVVIGHDAWLGHGVVVMPGVRIGIGAVVGSQAGVTRDVPDFAVAVGVPARVIRQRFEPALARRLLAVAWWDWDHATLAARLDELRDPAALVARYAPGVM